MCNRQVGLNPFFFKQCSSVFHSDTLLIFIKSNDFTSMEEMIQDCCCQCRIAQELAPLTCYLVGREYERCFVIHIINELKEQLGIPWFISHIHNIINDDQIVCCHAFISGARLAD